MVQRNIARSREALWIATSVLGAASTALAADVGDYLSYSVKGVAFQPQLDTSATFTDNLFYGSGATRVSDYIVTISPGLRIQWGRDGANQVAFEYMHDEVRVIDNSPFSSQQDRLDLTVRYTTSKIRWDGRDSIHFLSSLLGGSTGLLQQLVDRQSITDVHTVTYDWTEKTDIFVRASHFSIDYDSAAALLDSRSIDGTLGASYQWTPKLRASVEGFFGHTSISGNRGATAGPDSIFYGGFVGLRGTFTSKLTGSARLGYEQRDFVSGTGVSASTPAMAFDLTYQQSIKRSFVLRYDRRTYPSPQFQNQISVNDSVSLQADQLIGTSGRWLLRGTVRYSHNDLTSSQLSVGGGQVEVERVDQVFNAGLALIFQPEPWLRAMAAYEFENFDISFSDPTAAGLLRVVPYHNNRVSLSLSLGF